MADSVERKPCHKCGVAERTPTSSYCKACRKAYDKERLRKKRVFVQAYKLACGCAKCGYDASPVALELHHIDPATKTYTIGGQLISIPMPKLLEEFTKCEVLCSNCHRIHSFENDHHLS